MQGFEQVLKMMGLDPAAMEEKAKIFLADVEAKFAAEFSALHERFDALEQRLAAAGFPQAPEVKQLPAPDANDAHGSDQP